MAAGSGNWDNRFNWSTLGVPVPQDHVFIDPVNGLTVSGPTSTTQVKSLTLAVNQVGTVNLLVDPAGDLLIDQALTIAAGSRLAGSGTVTAMGGITNQGEIDLGSQGFYVAGGMLTNTGLVRGGGTIDNALVNSTSGEVRVAAGQRMHLTTTGDQFNEGRIDVVGNATQAAEIEFDGELTNNKITGNIAASHATLRFDGGLINHGHVGVSFGTSNVFGNINNNEGTITVTGASNVTFWDDLINNGTVKVSKGSTVVYFGKVSGSGSFPGGGTTFLEGDLVPGTSPGKLTFGGDVVFGALAHLESKLQGTTAGSLHDQLDIAGSVNLDGTLDLVPLAPYSDPEVRGTSHDFVILTAGASNGNFDTVQYNGSKLTSDYGTDGKGSFRSHQENGLFRNLTYTATTVKLQNLLAIEGDTDGDRDVDTADLTGMIINFNGAAGSGATWLTGDTDGDGDTDTADLTTGIINFTGAMNTAVSVPEPSCTVLLVLAIGCLSAVGTIDRCSEF